MYIDLLCSGAKNHFPKMVKHHVDYASGKNTPEIKQRKEKQSYFFLCCVAIKDKLSYCQNKTKNKNAWNDKAYANSDERYKWFKKIYHFAQFNKLIRDQNL